MPPSCKPQVFARFDVDGSGHIERNEFGALHSYLRVRMLFDDADKDKDDRLDETATKQLLRKVGREYDPAYAYDLDSDGWAVRWGEH